MNFDFLTTIPKCAALYNFCSSAEQFVVANPSISAFCGRNAIEWLLKTFYVKLYGIYPKNSSLFDLIEDAQFSSLVDQSLLSSIHFVRKLGNMADHSETVKPAAAKKNLECLYYAVAEILKFLDFIKDYPQFDASVFDKKIDLPVPPFEKNVSVNVPQGEKKKIKVVVKKKIASPKLEISEYETRKTFIDVDLAQSGWRVQEANGKIEKGTACIEIELAGMPNQSGVGFADYVLFDDDLKPLAVIEAKKTSVDEAAGRAQVLLYADLLEKFYGTRPLAYYTNGYKTMLVDGIYPDRRVFTFHTKSELHSILLRRGSFKKITDAHIKNEISDRPFVQEACTAVCESFNNLKRKALVVMATGTGKTRCSISIVDVLQRADWVKSVLFLADRTELVRQAKTAFGKYLPDSTICSLLENSDEGRDYNARIILSTYQTMVNLIDGDNRKFGIGKFDLIIVDECHRSVYNKYRAIFNYFDAMLLGLTATPKEFLDDYGTTYDLFELPKGKPTFNYDYATAVDEGYLVDMHLLDRTTDVLKDGVTYDDLTSDEKDEYDTLFTDFAGRTPEKIDSKLFYKYIINEPTIDAMLTELKTNGLRVNSGEELGKTIIFAQDHEHAKKIVERADFIFSEKGEGYCQLIDYSVNYASSVLEAFKEKEKYPIIAVSVDMLDTGIDVPEILNLVFFKKVFSVIKFWQMIGRGTRVCKDLNVFSPSSIYFKKNSALIKRKQEIQTTPSDEIVTEYTDKQGFYVFDFCNVFSFFKVHPQGNEPVHSLSVTQQIFETQLEILGLMQQKKLNIVQKYKDLFERLKTELCQTVCGLNRNDINVKTNLEYVDRYSVVASWDYVSQLHFAEIKKQITPLVENTTKDFDAVRFDLKILQMQKAYVEGDKDYSKMIMDITSSCAELLSKTKIPEIEQKQEILNKVQKQEFWKDADLNDFEYVRVELRDIMVYLDRKTKASALVTHFQDKIIEKQSDGKTVVSPFKIYKERVIDYLTENSNLLVLKKIKNIEPLDQKDIFELEELLWQKLGSKEEYDEIAKDISLGVFVRRIVGLDDEAINRIFFEYLAEYSFNAKQQEFLQQIVNYVRQNGDMVVSDLINSKAFEKSNYLNLFDGNLSPVKKLIDYLHNAINIIAA